MLLKKKSPIYSIFKRHYNAMLRSAKSSPISKNPEFELLPAMFIVTDYAAMNSGKNRMEIAKETKLAIASIFGKYDNDLFVKRCDLYGEIIRGKELRGDWFIGDVSALSSNPVSRCTILLGDIIYNPSCAEDYDNAPLMVYSIFDSMKFADSVMKLLISEMISLFNDIYDFNI